MISSLVYSNFAYCKFRFIVALRKRQPQLIIIFGFVLILQRYFFFQVRDLFQGFGELIQSVYVTL